MSEQQKPNETQLSDDMSTPPKDVNEWLLSYERINEAAFLKVIRLEPGEHVLMRRPFGWHLDGQHLPNQAEHFERDGVCRDLGMTVVCDYGEHIAVVRPRAQHLVYQLGDRRVRVSVMPDGALCRDSRGRVAVRNVQTNWLSYVPERRLVKQVSYE